MPWIILKKKAEIVGKYKIEKDTITIGSLEKSDVYINDKKVSTEHTIIVYSKGKYFLKDLATAFGTYLNGEKIENEEELEDGDVIQVGEHTIIFALSEKTIKEERTIVVEKQQEETVITKPVKTYNLLAIYGPFFGRVYRLNLTETRIGRDPKFNDVVLADGKIKDMMASRRQCVITVKGGEYIISDKRSTVNRTRVNQQELSPEDEVILKPGDEIQTGRTIFRVVEEGRYDFSPPHKTGDFWIRWKIPAITILGSIIMSISLFMIFNALIQKNIITQKPSNLQFKKTVWGEFTPVGEYGAYILMGNFTGKNKVEIVTVTHTGEIKGFYKYKPIWEKMEIGTKVSSFPISADVDMSGTQDIILTTEDGRIRVYDGLTGQEIWKSRYIPEGKLLSPVFLDGIIITSGTQGNIHLTEINKDEVTSINIGEENLFSSPTVVENNILLGTDGGKLYIFDPKTLNCSLLMDISKELYIRRGLPIPEPQQIRTTIGIGDELQVAVFSRQRSLIIIDINKKKIVWDCDDDKFMPWRRELPENYAPPIIGDIDKDKHMETIVASYSGGVYALKNGEVIWKTLQEYNFTSPPAMGDFNKDGIPDIVIASCNKVHLIDGKNGEVLWESEFYPFKISHVVIGDVNGEKKLSIGFADPKGTPIVYQSNAKIPKNTIVWSMAFKDNKHTGAYTYRPQLGKFYAQMQIFGTLFILPLLSFFIWRSKRRKKIRIINIEKIEKT